MCLFDDCGGTQFHFLALYQTDDTKITLSHGDSRDLKLDNMYLANRDHIQLQEMILPRRRSSCFKFDGI